MSALPTETALRSEAADEFAARREVPLVPAASIAGRALVTVIAIMTFLASLAAGSAWLVAGAARDWQRSVSDELTIQVKPVAGIDTDAQAAKAVGIAKAAPGIAAAELFGRDQAAKLLEPWLGSDLDLKDLPVPQLVVVKLDPSAPRDLSGLRHRLETEVVGASLDDHGMWLSRLATMARTVVLMALAIVALVLVATALAVGFATRAVIAGNREIITVLHFVGAEDRYIARQFQRHFRRLGLRGGLIGGGVAAAAFLAAGALNAALAATPGSEQLEAMFGTFSLGIGGFAAIAAIALGMAAATGSLSRAIVFRHLRALE